MESRTAIQAINMLTTLSAKDVGEYCIQLAKLIITARCELGDEEDTFVDDCQYEDEPISTSTNKLIPAISWCLWLIYNNDYNSPTEKTKIKILIKEIHKLLRFNSKELVAYIDGKNTYNKEIDRVIIDGFR